MNFYSMLLVLMMIFFNTSCNRYADFQTQEGISFIRNTNPRIDSADIITWDFGVLKSKSAVTKGFNVNVKLNPLDADALIELYRNKFIDSWLVVIKKIESSGRVSNIGHIYYPLVTKKKDSEELNTNLINSFSFSIYYDAAAIYEGDLFAMKCPPAGLKKSIDQIEIKENKDFDENAADLRVSFGQKITVHEDDILKSEFLALIIPAGVSLEGEYRVSIALYNGKDKTVFSNYVEARDIIIISKEKDKNTADCG